MNGRKEISLKKKRWRNKRVDEWMDGENGVDRWMDGWMDGMNGWMDGWMDERGEWMDGWMDGWMG